MNPRMKRDSTNESSLKQRHQEATRRAILQAAEAQLAESGLHGTRMEDVAARAGVSVGTIYNHLGDRQTMLAQLLSARRHELVARVDDELRGSQSQDFDAQLQGFVRAVFDHFQTHLPLFRILAAEELASDSAAKRSLLAALLERAQGLLDRGVEQGRVPAQDTALYSLFLLGMIRGVFAPVVSGNLDTAGVPEQVAAFFLRGVQLR